MSEQAANNSVDGYRLTFRRVLRSEWTKLTSVRSTWIILGLVALVTVGLAAAIGRTNRPTAGTQISAATVAAHAFQGVDLFSLVLGVFGIVAITGEYGSGAIRATLTAVPRRLPVLWAKAFVLVGAATPVMLASCVAAVYATQMFNPAANRIGLSEGALLRATGGAAVAPLTMAVLGLAIGTMLRHTAGAITAFVVAMLVLPAVLPGALPGAAGDTIIPYVPVAASQALYTGSGGNPFRLLSPGLALLTLVGWIVLALGGAAAVLQRRDA
jgi:ABC-type transport system involved in multi-copper enzyme maturation permease subunit